MSPSRANAKKSPKLAPQTPPRPARPANGTALVRLDDLRLDPHNRRTHPDRNLDVIGAALAEVGAARSIVLDEANEVLAGNGVVLAARGAGIGKVQIIDAEGDTLVAVRRRGLTPEQKRALAMFDNRAGELAEWNLDQLRLDHNAGLDLAPWFSAEELDELLAVPVAGEWTEAAAGLPAGDRVGFQQVTFLLSDRQVEVVRAAVARAKAAGDFGETGNLNSNGNALARICEAYHGGGEGSHPATD